MASGGRLQPGSGRLQLVGVGNRARVRARGGKSTPHSRQNGIGGNRPLRAVNLPLGCGQIHGERGRGRGKEKAEAGTLGGGDGTLSPLAAPLFQLQVPAAPPSPLAARPLLCSSFEFRPPLHPRLLLARSSVRASSSARPHLPPVRTCSCPSAPAAPAHQALLALLRRSAGPVVVAVRTCSSTSVARPPGTFPASSLFPGALFCF